MPSSARWKRKGGQAEYIQMEKGPFPFMPSDAEWIGARLNVGRSSAKADERAED